ncbi:MAG TPA: hypothetical protein VMD51_03860 [Mycobacterium sp.]|nr:hypothetical protein [Mycobacterium sp.]
MAVGPIWFTHVLWPKSACAGAATLRTAAVKPLAMAVAIPNFFTFFPSSSIGR